MVRPRVARGFVNLADAVLHQCIRHHSLVVAGVGRQRGKSKQGGEALLVIVGLVIAAAVAVKRLPSAVRSMSNRRETRAHRRRRMDRPRSRRRVHLFLSIHHDSVPDSLLENWEFEGKRSHFSDRFSGYSVFVSRHNPDLKTSLTFAELVDKEMKAHALQYAQQYTQAIMGRYQ